MKREIETVKQITIASIRKFSKERDQNSFHTPANLTKAVSIEEGELLECFRWSDTDRGLTHVRGRAGQRDGVLAEYAGCARTARRCDCSREDESELGHIPHREMLGQ